MALLPSRPTTTPTAQVIQKDDGYLRKLRSDSVRNVKATNGLLTFEQKVKDYEDASEGEDQWHD